LPGARLDEITRANHAHRQKRRGADVVVGFEFADFQDHLERRVAAGLHHGRDFILHLAKLAREKRPAVDHHVDLVGAVGDRRLHFRQTGFQRRLAAGKRRRDGSDPHGRIAAERAARVLHHRGIDAYGRDLRHAQLRVVRRERLLAERGDFARRVFAFERREIDHRRREFQAPELSKLF
jgi:hypothetical protein